MRRPSLVRSARAARQVAQRARRAQDVAVGGGDWRSRRRDATHRRIYETAMRLFQEHGFEQVSIRQLTTAAQVSAPTFYAHYPSKEHLIMQLPSPQHVAALLAEQPGDLPLTTSLRQMFHVFIGQWSPEETADVLARWKVIAGTPALRTQAAAFERTAAGMVTDALPPEASARLSPADAVIVDAYMAAYTRALLAWADADGRQGLGELVDEAIDALQRGGVA